MISDYLKGYIDALCYPIYRGARKAGCVEVPVDQVDEATDRIRRIGCIAVVGREVQPGIVEVWAVRNHSVRLELEDWRFNGVSFCAWPGVRCGWYQGMRCGGRWSGNRRSPLQSMGPRPSAP